MSSRAHRRVNRSVPLMSLGSLPATYRSTLASSRGIQRPLAAFEGLSATITRNGFYAVQSTARSFHAGAAQGLKEQQQGWWMESLYAMSRSPKESRSLRWEWCPGWEWRTADDRNRTLKITVLFIPPRPLARGLSHQALSQVGDQSAPERDLGESTASGASPQTRRMVNHRTSKQAPRREGQPSG